MYVLMIAYILQQLSPKCISILLAHRVRKCTHTTNPTYAFILTLHKG
jgi:hypothetical protein